jgi:hypothetical protein
MTRQQNTTHLHHFPSTVQILESQGLKPEWAQENCTKLLEKISHLQRAELDNKSILALIKSDIENALNAQKVFLENVERSVETGVEILFAGGSIQEIDPEFRNPVIEKIKKLSESDFRAMSVLVALRFGQQLTAQQQQLDSQETQLKQIITVQQQLGEADTKILQKLAEIDASMKALKEAEEKRKNSSLRKFGGFFQKTGQKDTEKQTTKEKTRNNYEYFEED